MHFPFHISVILLANIYTHNQARTDMDMVSKMLLNDLLTLLKDIVILDLFSKMHKNDYVIGDLKMTVVSNISYDIKILKSQCYLEGTITLMSLLFRELQLG